MAVVASATGAAVFGLSGVAAGVAGGALLGAGAGALYSGITKDGNVLNSALTGGLIGGAVGGLGAWGAGQMAGTGALSAVPTAAGAGAINPATGLAWEATGSGLAGNAPAIAGAANNPALASSVLNAPTSGAVLGSIEEPLASGLAYNQPATVPSAVSELASKGPATSTGLKGTEMLGYGLAGTAAMSLLGSMNQPKLSSTNIPGQNPAYIRPYTYNVSQNQSAYPTTPQYGANGLPILPTSEQNYFNQSYTTGTPYKAANGGLMAAGPVERMSQNVMGGQGNMFPQSQQERTNFATPTQMPVSAEIIRSDYDTKTNPYTGVMMADGGITYDAATQTYKGLPMSNAQTAPEIQVLERQAAQAPVQQEPNPFAMFAGMGFPVLGPQEPSKPQEMETFAPSTSLYKDEIGNLTSQWQSANPNVRSYNAANQSYGAGTPTNAQLLALKNAQEQQAYNDRLQAFQSQNYQGYAHGGDISGAYNLGGYSDGGRLLKGPGDGVSDDIPAVIGDKQPARLADGEFVVPARIVSELGNGSTDAGAKRLYAMMDRIQSGRKKTIGKDRVAVNTKSDKHLPA